MISGGPGSGKSSFAKMFAAELAAENEWRVLYVPLHQFDFVGDFRAAIRKFVIEDFHILEHDPLNPDKEIRRLVVFFDGLDELAMHGASGQEAASDFVAALDRAIGTVNYRECRLQVILGGREIVVQANERVFRREQQALYVLPYVVPKQQEAPRCLLNREGLHDPNDLLASDQRDLWWQKYGTASGRGHHCLPEPLGSSALIEVSGQPLLNFLLALSFDRGRIVFGPALNLNELYKDLLDAVWERRWGEGRQLPEVERLQKPEFERLLEEVGLAAWQSGTRGVAASTVAKICRDTGLERELRSFEKGAEKGALTLLAAFYFRQASRTGERTFEFTHKSFGEYLTSRRIVRAVADIHDDRADKARRRRPSSEEAALAEWCRMTGPAALDEDLLAFLRRQMAVEREGNLKDHLAVAGWRQTFAELLSYDLHNGLPMHKLGLSSFQEMTRQARNAEEALLAALYCCASFVQTVSKIDWPDKYALSTLLNRLDHHRPGRVVRHCLGWLDTTTGDCGHELYQVELIDAHLQASNLHGAELIRANLAGGNLARANLNGAILDGAHFYQSDISDADLSAAHLLGATLWSANLQGANLSKAQLGRAEFENANLEGANLEGANLQGANLVEVRQLDAARGLDKVESWRGAKIERKWIDRLGLDADELGLEVVDDLEEDDLEEEEYRADTEAR